MEGAECNANLGARSSEKIQEGHAALEQSVRRFSPPQDNDVLVFPKSSVMGLKDMSYLSHLVCLGRVAGRCRKSS